MTAVQGVGQVLAGEQFQGVHLLVGGAAACAQRLFGRGLADDALSRQVAQQLIEIQPAILVGELSGHPDSLGNDPAFGAVDRCVGSSECQA